MGTKYSTVSLVGFNASPPPDDGTQTASNTLQWAKHYNKIGFPLKTGVESINSRVLTALDQSAREVTASGATTAADHNRTLQIASTVTATITVTLMDAATAAAGYIVSVNNQSALTHTIGRATASNVINGSTSNISILPFETLLFLVNAAGDGYICGVWSAPGQQPYDIIAQYNGTIGNVDALRMTLPRAITLPASLTGSYAKVLTAPTAETTFTMTKNGSSIGSIVFAIGATTATFTFASAVTFAAGDVLRVTGPASADVTLANFSATLKATR